MTTRIPISALQELSKKAPAGYLEHITSGGTIENGLLVIEYDAYMQLWERFKVGARPLPLHSPVNPLGPGTLFSVVIKQLTGSDSSRCSRCSARVQQMNTWGWWQSWRNRGTVATWIIEEARRRGHEITERTASDLMRAAFKELRRDRTPNKLNNMKSQLTGHIIRVVLFALLISGCVLLAFFVLPR